MDIPEKIGVAAYNMTESSKKSKETGFAERLRLLRIQKGLSQTELAKRINMHNTHISRYERGESLPSSQALKALADCLDVSTDYLYDGNEEDAAVADFHDRDFLRIFKEAESLDEKDKEVLKILIESFLARKKIKAMVS
jgi:transcriptional regulator with XRE-family HTH domain